MSREFYGKAVTVTVILITLLFTGCGKSRLDQTASVLDQTAAGSADIRQGIVFSKEDYFYAEDTEVALKIDKPGKIYYTTDGTDPDKEQTLYKSPLKLAAGDETKANVIKAKAYYKDGTESAVVVHTYFVGKNVKDRFDTLVFSVTTDPYNLYDYNYGIFVEGKLRDDYAAKHPGKEINPDAPANYNMRGRDSEREVYLEVFQPDGTRVIGQEAGIRTYGGWSRAREQKSIKIFARKSYDPEHKKLNYAFFPDNTSASGTTIDSYKRLVLRNCGNDNGFGFIRDELFQTLAVQAGYSDTEAVRPAALFVNGEYRGFYWLHEVYEDQYFKEHYGKYKGSFEVLEGGETFKEEASDGSNKQFVQDYEDIYNTYSKMDLTNDKAYQKLCDAIDVENYLSYYALNIYLGNEDWPYNNYKTFRYYAAEGEKYKKAPFDGKWRYLLHDMDFTFGIYGTGASQDNIGIYIGKDGTISDSCPLFGQLMQREDCREIFIKKTLDLLNGAFSPDNLSPVLDEMNESRLNELKHTYGKGLMDEWVTFTQLPDRLQAIKAYAKLRASHILAKYKDYFGMGDIYTLTVTLPQDCQAQINSYHVLETFTGNYYSNYDTTITAVVPEGKKAGYWLVNGKKVKQKELVITKDRIKDGKVEAELVLK